MSVHKTSAGAYRVMWRDPDGAQRQRTFTLKKDAERADRELHRKRELAPFGVALETTPMTVAELYADWTETHASGLSPHTQAHYAATWRRHLEPRIGKRDLRELTPAVCADLAASMLKAGVGESARAKALVLLSSLLRRAVVLGKIGHHPMRGAVRIPQPKRKRVISPPTPATIWKLAAKLRAAGDEPGRLLVLLVGFAGLRPGEALALDWQDVGKRALHVDGSVAHGTIRATKTGQGRTVTLVPALEAELVAHRLNQGLPASGLVLAHNGQPWNDTRYRNWRKRSFSKTAAGLGIARLYDLRHAFASLLLHEGRNVIEVAAQLGHSPSMCLDTYAHVMAELGNRRLTAAQAIARANNVGATLAPVEAARAAE